MITEKDSIKVRRLSLEDLQKRVELLNNPLVNEYLNCDEVFTLDNTIRWFDTTQRNTNRCDLAILVDNNPVGMGGIVNIDCNSRRGEVYLYLDPMAQGRGIASHLMAEIKRVATSEFNLQKLIAWTYSKNLHANSFWERNGFELEGTLRRHQWHRGEIMDRNIYALFL